LWLFPTLERIPELAESALGSLAEAGYYNRITIIHRDSSLEYPEEKPYQRILVTAAAPAVPQSLIEQLEDGEIVVIPVGGAHFYQTLLCIRKKTEKSSKKTWVE
jgi:protein-L-isoaspartate(D-aspartate) O-methyltransferase